VLAACAAGTPGEAPPPRAQDLAAEGWRVATSKEGIYELAWRPAGGVAVPRNRDFDVEIALFRDGEPLTGAGIRPRGWMPEHGHGLARSPQVVEEGAGRYRVQSMLLHMRGHWEVLFDVVHSGVGDIVAFEVDL